MNRTAKTYNYTLTLFGICEQKAKQTADALKLPTDISVSIRSESHILYMTLSAHSESTLAIAKEAALHSGLSSHTADQDVHTLEQAAVYFLKKKGLTLSLAESCTGGMCAARIVNVSGASDVFLGSVVSYANSAKEDLLGVKESTLAEHGAVSAQTVCEMADGARSRFGSDIAISVSGIAGPGGGSPQKPVGTVYFGVSDADGASATRADFGDIGRENVRESSVCLMLEKVIELALSK